MRYGVACAAIAIPLFGSAFVHAEEAAKPAQSAKAAPAPEPPLPPIEQARPREPELPKGEPVPWEHHIEVGGGLAVSEMPASVDGAKQPTPVRFAPHIGFHINLSWQVFRYLRFTGYLVEHDNPIDLPQGSLGQPGKITGPSVHAYTFGVRFSPTLPIGSRLRLWATAGAGWGRLEYGRLTVTEQTGMPFTLRERAASIVEVPLGLGASVMIIPRWLSAHIELTGALVPSQIGDALESAQAIDGAGKMRNIGPMPRLDAHFVQTLGLALHL
jgi:hypothetical protein